MTATQKVASPDFIYQLLTDYQKLKDLKLFYLAQQKIS